MFQIERTYNAQIDELKKQIEGYVKTIETMKRRNMNDDFHEISNKTACVPDDVISPELLTLSNEAMNVRLSALEQTMINIESDLAITIKGIILHDNGSNAEASEFISRKTNTETPYPIEDKRFIAIQESLQHILHAPRIVTNVGTNTKPPLTSDATFNTDNEEIDMNTVNNKIDVMHTDILSAIGFLTSNFGKRETQYHERTLQPTAIPKQNTVENICNDSSVDTKLSRQITMCARSSDNASVSVLSFEQSRSRLSSPRNWYTSSSDTIDLLDDLPMDCTHPPDHLSCISEDSDAETLIASSSLSLRIKIVNIGSCHS